VHVAKHRIAILVKYGDFKELANHYAWAVPNQEALRAIQEHSPVKVFIWKRKLRSQI
jgi:hypothetical protein